VKAGIARVAATAAAALTIVALAGAQVPNGVETFDAAWRIVRDTHFDKSLNGVDWNAISAELRPKAVAARTAGELRAVVQDMLGRLGQSHFVVIPASADGAHDAPKDLTGRLGFDVRLVGGDLLVTRVDAAGSGAAAGVRPGWKVVAINAEPVAPLVNSIPASLGARLRTVEGWKIAHSRLNGPSGSKVRVRFEDGSGKPIPLDLERQPEPGEPVTVGNLPTMFVRVDAYGAPTPAGRRAGVVRFNVWMTAVDPLFQHAMDGFRTSDGVIVDLRGNPGGLAAMLMGISGFFIDERKPLGVMKTRDNELRFNVNPRRVSATGERVVPFAGPVAILVDGMSGSASECFTGGMQSVGRVRVFGEPTMGQALPALFERLPNADVLIHAYGDFVTADGTRLEGRGVIPDEIVPLERAHLLAGRDRVMEAALAWIDSAAPSQTTRR
jgi:carboxyl-terminal processing protease